MSRRTVTGQRRPHVKRKAAAAPARGGARAGAGRPKAIDWAKVERDLELPGATVATVALAHGVPEIMLDDVEVMARLRRLEQVGQARYELTLRRAIKSRGERTTDKAGSVNALALQARNCLDWDKQIPTQETQPDLTTARQRLTDMFVRLADNRSEFEGRKVTVEELLHRVATGELEAEEAPC